MSNILSQKGSCGSSPSPTSPTSNGCGSPQWKGDNSCDDENNNESCDWDGGDCCGDYVGTWFCSACECLDPSEQGGGGWEVGGCGSPQYQGDNFVILFQLKIRFMTFTDSTLISNNLNT